MQHEVEQKFPVSDLTTVEARLAHFGAKAAGDERQLDRYFNHPARDFGATDEALRVRSIGEENFVTYKGPKLSVRSKARRELELPIAAGAAAAEKFGELLAALGFHRVATVAKRRRKFDVEWLGRAGEVALDEVDGLGRFVEIEFVVAEAEWRKAEADLESLAVALGLAGAERRSYLELYLTRRTTPEG
jgi:adenylate cyclase class 2